MIGRIRGALVDFLRTIDTLSRHVPAAVPGIAFLSGAQTGEEARRNLDALVEQIVAISQKKDEVA